MSIMFLLQFTFKVAKVNVPGKQDMFIFCKDLAIKILNINLGRKKMTINCQAV